MGLPGMVLSAISTVVGAIMYWATTAQTGSLAQNHGFRLSTVGIILMVAGVVGFITSLAVYMSSRRTPAGPTHTLNREVVDDRGNSTLIHEEKR